MKKITRRMIIFALTGLLLLAAPVRLVFGQASGSSSTAAVITINGPITPVQAEYLERGLSEAESQGDRLVIVQIDTPGGAIDVMGSVQHVLAFLDALTAFWQGAVRAPSFPHLSLVFQQSIGHEARSA